MGRLGDSDERERGESSLCVDDGFPLMMYLEQTIKLWGTSLLPHSIDRTHLIV